MACLEQGVPPAAYPFHQSMVENLSNPWAENYGSLEKMASHVAAELFEAAGQRISPEYCLYDQLRKVANWNPYFDRYVQPVFNAICQAGLAGIAEDQENAEQVKRAFVGHALGLLGKAFTSTPALAKTIIAGGAAGGAGLGALYWALNRHSTEDNDKNEAMKARIKLYRRITSEISEDLKRNNATSEDTERNIIAQDAGTNNII